MMRMPDSAATGVIEGRRLDPERPSPLAAQGDEFARKPVPASATTAAYKIGIMLLASNISLPVFIVGGELGTSLGLRDIVVACLWGGAILALLAGLCGYAGARSRLTTYVLITEAFGRRGGELINFLLSISAIGWFGVVIMLFAHTMVRAALVVLQGTTLSLWAVMGMILMAITTIVGFRALNLLSNIMLPLKLGMLIWAVAAAVSLHGGDLSTHTAGASALDVRTAISFIVGGWVVGAIVSPDFSRFARNAGGGAIGCSSALGIGYPLVLIAAAIPAMLTGEKDLVVTMEALGMGFTALCIVLLACWTNGASILYNGSLMMAAVFRRPSRSSLVWIVGGSGLILGLSGLNDLIVPYLTLLSTAIPPIAGVYLPRFFLDQRNAAMCLPSRDWHPEAVASWSFGVIAASIGEIRGYALTGIVAIDSLLLTALLYLGLEAFRLHRIRRTLAGI